MTTRLIEIEIASYEVVRVAITVATNITGHGDTLPNPQTHPDHFPFGTA